MDKIIIKDKSKAAEDFVKRLNSYSNFGVFSIQDKGAEAKSVIFVISALNGGISKEAREALESYSCSKLVGYIAIIVLYEKTKLVSHIEAERALANAGIASSYTRAVKLPATDEEIKLILDDIEKEEIKLPYRFPLSKTIGRITKELNK